MAATLSRWPTNSILARLATTRRAATVTDRAFACRTHHLAYRDVVERQFGAWVEEQQDGFFQSSWAAQPHEIILFEGEPCGYVCVDDRPADVHLRELVLAPHYQGQGIGSAVLDAVIEHANARRVPVRLGTHLAKRAANLYRRVASARSAARTRSSCSNGLRLTRRRSQDPSRAPPAEWGLRPFAPGAAPG